VSIRTADLPKLSHFGASREKSCARRAFVNPEFLDEPWSKLTSGETAAAQ
jgi:hypothetical protein